MARLPGVRSINRYARNFDENARSSAQEIYNNLAESIAVSEVYIVPVDFDPDAIDPITKQSQQPIATFDALIVGRTAKSTIDPGFGKASGRLRTVDEIEIHEYRLMREQLAVLRMRFPTEDRIDRLYYPAIAGREVITCDNTRYSPSKPDERDRTGLVYSVPFYGMDGVLRGMVSAVILTSAVKDMLPAESFVLHNPRYRYIVGRDKNVSQRIASTSAPQATMKAGLLYSEAIKLDITDLTGGWTLWAGLHDRNYWSSAGAVSASAKAATQDLIIIIMAIVFTIIIYTVGEKYRAAQASRRELEACIAERTRDLAAATEASNAANKAKSQFLSVMSHEIRTPMTAIVGMADLLSHGRLERHENRYVRVIQSSAEALLNIVNDILDLSKIEAGKIELHPASHSVDTIVSDVIGMFAEQVGSKGIGLVGDVDRSIPAAICVDGARLRQVLVNLVGNAVKFTSKGEIRVSVDLGGSADAGRTQILFEVSDTGIGIPPEAGRSIFEPFRQGRNGASGPAGGTGLGLSISRTLVEMMGGKISYRSIPGDGTTFIFDIAAAPATKPAAAPVGVDYVAELNAPAKSPRFQGASVLVAEDNPVSQEVIRTYLERLGCDVIVANDGSMAVAQAKARRFDAILMDCQMPGMDGFEATRLIRQETAGSGPDAVPIVALTANAFVEDRARCLEAGMTDYLSKPFTATSLLQMLSKHLPSATAPTA